MGWRTLRLPPSPAALTGSPFTVRSFGEAAATMRTCASVAGSSASAFCASSFDAERRDRSAERGFGPGTFRGRGVITLGWSLPGALARTTHVEVILGRSFFSNEGSGAAMRVREGRGRVSESGRRCGGVHVRWKGGSGRADAPRGLSTVARASKRFAICREPGLVSTGNCHRSSADWSRLVGIRRGVAEQSTPLAPA